LSEKTKEKIVKAYQLYEDIMGKLEEGVLVPDKLEITLKFEADQAEATYTEHFTYMPPEKREALINQTINMMIQKTEQLKLILREAPFDITLTRIKDGAKLKMKGPRSLVLTPILSELLAQLTIKDVLKTTANALFTRAYTPQLWKGNENE